VPGRCIRVLPLAALAVVLPSAWPAFAAATYLRATVDPDGQLRIVTTAGRTIAPIKDSEQVGFAKPQISPDGGAVGWLAEYPNCCTSYPVPLKLQVMHADGRIRTFTGRGLPIWRWGFLPSGKQLAFQQETVHGGLGIHYELRDVASGRLIAEYDPAAGPDSQPLPSQSVPRWVAELDARR
jgi:hypothetical protein